MSTIVLTGGGTAGHCAPNLALIPYLKKDFDTVCYIGSKTGIEKKLIENERLPYYAVSTVKFKRNFSLSNLKIPFILAKGVSDAGKYLDKIKPDVIFSKGGYVALPVVFAARKRKIPVVSHESDFSLGLANRLAARFSEIIITAFPETAKKIKRGVYLGNPLRKSLFGADKKTALSYYGLSGEKPVLLLTGGSQGSKYLNKILRSSLPDLLPKFEVLHVCGKGNVDKKIAVKGYVQTEFTEMDKAYAAADICVSRAGSNTLFELLALKIPTLLIPLPKGTSRGDQIVNAKYFQKKGLVSVIFQDALTEESLIYGVNSLYLNRRIIKNNLERYGIKDQSRAISKIIYDCANKKQP